MANIRRQVEPFLLAAEGENPAIFVNNLDWTAPLSALDFLRDVGKHFRVNQMVKKEAIAARLNSDEGISYTEFVAAPGPGLPPAVPRLRLHPADRGQRPVGQPHRGSDLIHRVEGASVHLLTTPLLTDSSGRSSARARATPSGCPRR